MALNDIVQISIAIQDAAPSTPNFSTPLILASEATFSGVREYAADPSGLAALVADGVTSGKNAHRKASAIVANSPHCATFKVAHRPSVNAQSLTITPNDLVAGHKFSADICVDGGPVTTVTVIKLQRNITTA